MRVTTDTCSLETRSLYEVIDITPEMNDLVTRASARHGRLVAIAADRGCALVVNEREAGFWEDLRGVLERFAASGVTPEVPIGDTSITLPIVDGSLELGTWQRVLFVELERPGPRSVMLQVLDDATVDDAEKEPVDGGPTS
ncbi:MAG: YjbQ family protein [Actinomycetota bacterium]|nr:YjbQ family protein [Actinomycetota bacterium]